MNFIHATSPKEGAEKLAGMITERLLENKRVLWLLSGGSNLPISNEVMGIIRKAVPKDKLANLIVTLTDERYGLVGHKDSNWTQLIETGFDFKGFESFPVLTGLSLEETVKTFGERAKLAFDMADFVIAQFGIGADGHIAGILPGTPAVSDQNPTSGYVADPFTRVTLTFNTLLQIDAAFSFVFGDSKKEAIQNLVTHDMTLNNEPCQILKQIDEAYLYSDQV